MTSTHADVDPADVPPEPEPHGLFVSRPEYRRRTESNCPTATPLSPPRAWFRIGLEDLEDLSRIVRADKRVVIDQADDVRGHMLECKVSLASQSGLVGDDVVAVSRA